MTYSRGTIYKNRKEIEPRIKTDKNYFENIDAQMNTKNLPIKSESIESIIYDPPFLCRTGKAINRDKTAIRYGYYTSRTEQIEEYTRSIEEFSRVLKTSGVLIIKIGDMKGNEYITSHVDMINIINEKGLTVIDIFIKVRNRNINQTDRNQRVAKQNHTFFIVAKKKRKYTRR